MRSEAVALIVGGVALAAGCMSGDDYSAALVGDRPPSDIGPPDALRDARRVLDRAVLDAEALEPDVCGRIEDCNGLDDDCDGAVDEDVDRRLPPDVVCCTPVDGGLPDVRCGDAPPGTWLDPGWAYVSPTPDEPGLLVTVEPIGHDRWCSIEVARALDTARCPDGEQTTGTVRGVDLYIAAAFANAWTCAYVDRPRCYSTDAAPLELPGGPVTPDWPGRERLSVGSTEACGARLLSDREHARVRARAGSPPSCAGSCAGSLAAEDALIRDATGLAAWASGWEWVWPVAGVAHPGVSVPLAGCDPQICREREIEARDGLLAEDAAAIGFRIACPPVAAGLPNPCTRGGSRSGVCNRQSAD